MKNYLAAAAAALALLSAPAATAQQTSYALWCRGGGDMQMVVGTNSIDGHAVTWVRFHFTPMTTAATAGTPPGPGQCSWLDRPLSAGEPQMVQLSARDVFAETTVNGGALATIDFNGAGASADKARAIWSAYQAGSEFRVMVYNTGGGYMNVTEVAH